MVAGMEKETITTIKIGYLNHKVQHISTWGIKVPILITGTHHYLVIATISIRIGINL